MNKFFALVRRALQTEARMARGHFARFALGGFVLWTLVTTRWEIFSRGAPGLDLFRSVSYYNFYFITFLGTAFFSTAITEEKEERTLGLLKMAGVGPTALILGKWTPLMLGAFFLLSVQIPFTVLATTLGGVLPQQIGAAYASLVAHLFFVGSLGLFCSVVMATTTGACILAGGVLLVQYFLPVILLQLFRTSSGTFLVDVVISASMVASSMNAHSALGGIMLTGFNLSWWSTQVISNLCAGCLLLFAAWGVFDLCTRNEKEGGELTFFDRVRKKMPGQRQRRVWNAALLWKEYQLTGGGPLFLLMKFCLYLTFMLAATIVVGFRSNDFIETFGGMLFSWSLFFIVLETAIMTARIYRNELSQKTWSTLVLLPRSSSEILYSKLLGGLSVLIPLSGTLCLGQLLVFDEIWDVFEELLGSPEAVLGFTYFITQVVLSIHLSTYLSVSQKWAIWPVAVFLAGFLVFVGNVTVLSCLFVGASVRDTNGIFLLGIVVSTILIPLLQVQIGRQLIVAAAE